MQDMQHQISTKTLALQILQREHDQLLAAFSRSQIRCATLEKKSQVSDYEISTLLEEKGRFQRQIEALESQVMAMSAQLQARNVEETRQFRCDREAWERDRDGMQRRIRDLEAAQSTAGPTNDGTPISNDIFTASESLGTLREEIVRLQRRCSELEGLLQDIQGETEHMGPVLATLTNMSVRISALSSQTRSDLKMGPTAEQEVEPERE
jgi:chromosome segregation ATPase